MESVASCPPAVDTLEGVLEAIEAKQADFLALGIQRVGVFGSFGRREQGPESDVDLVLEWNTKDRSGLRLVALIHQLERALGRGVDVISRDYAAPCIEKAILSDGRFCTFSA